MTEEIKKKRTRHEIRPKHRTPYRYTPEFLDDLANKLSVWIRDPGNLFIEDFCTENNISSKRIHDLMIPKSETFKEAYEIAQQIQMTRLAKWTMAKKVDIATGIFLMKSICHLQERVFVGVGQTNDDNFIYEFFGIKKGKK